MERKYDLTKGDVFQTILMFMLPILAGNVFQQLYSAVDTIIVGRTLGSDALASVGSIGSLQFLVFGFCSGLAGGVTVVTSQFIGAGKTENARRSTAVIYMIWAVVSLLCTVVGIVCLPGLLHILNMPENLFQRAYAYQLVCFIGLGGQLLYNVESSLLRAIGNSKVPLIFLIISSVLNIILDFVFILVFHMDVVGAAAATILAQSLSGVGCLIYSFRKYPQLRVRKEDFKISFAFLADHLRVGLPLSIQDSITGVGMMVFQSALNGMGADAIAAYTACSKLETFVEMPMYSIAVAMVTFTAQNFGAKQYQRIRKGMKVSLLSCLFFSVVVGGLIIVFCKPLVSIFVGSGAAEVIRLSRIYNSIEASCLWCAALLFTYRGAVQGTGNTKIPMMGGFLELLMRVFAALCLSRIWGFPGLAMAYPLAWIFAALLNMWYYRKLDKNDFQCTRTSSI